MGLVGLVGLVGLLHQMVLVSLVGFSYGSVLWGLSMGTRWSSLTMQEGEDCVKSDQSTEKLPLKSDGLLSQVWQLKARDALIFFHVQFGT